MTRINDAKPWTPPSCNYAYEPELIAYVFECTPEENEAFLKALHMEATKTWPPEKRRRARFLPKP